MSFAGLIAHNLWARKARTLFTTLAVAIGVMTVVTLGIVTDSFRATATGLLRVADSDFTVAQRNVDDVFNSALTEEQVRELGAVPGVESTVGVLGAVTNLDADNPLFIEIGVRPDRLTEFGVRIVAGRVFAPTATDEMMLGELAAANLNKHVGDAIELDGKRYRIVGVYRTGQVFADAGSMFPLVALQGHEHKSGLVTLAFIRTTRGVPVATVRARVEREFPELVTVRLVSEAGLVDRNLTLFSALDRASSIVTVIVGAIIVMNTLLLSFFQRIREFGILRAIGWSRRRLVALVTGEAIVIGLLGMALGVGLSFAATRILEDLPSLVGLLDPRYTTEVFARALYVAVGTVLLGSLYPTIRAAVLVPLEALRHE